MFSKACQYAIRATVLIAMESRNGRRMSLVEIAERTGSPQAEHPELDHGLECAS